MIYAGLQNGRSLPAPAGKTQTQKSPQNAGNKKPAEAG
jgi:hypothetical protein